MKSHLLKIPYSRYCTIYSLEIVPEEKIALVSYILFRNSKHENLTFWSHWRCLLGRKYHFMQFLPKNQFQFEMHQKYATLILKTQMSYLVENILIWSFHQTIFTFIFSTLQDQKRDRCVTDLPWLHNPDFHKIYYSCLRLLVDKIIAIGGCLLLQVWVFDAKDIIGIIFHTFLFNPLWYLRL